MSQIGNHLAVSLNGDLPVRVSTLAAISALCILATSSADSLGAQSYPANHLRDRYDVTLSGASVILSSRLRVDGETLPGTDINVEEILGLNKDKFQPRFAFTWRPGGRHELEVGYQFVRRDATKALDRDIVFRDSTYHVGSRVNTTFNSDQAFLTYRFAFYSTPNAQIGMGVGVGALFLDISLDALVAGQSNSIAYSRAKKYTAPTGSIGGFGKWAFGSQSLLLADLRAIQVNISDLDATIWEGGFSYRYYFVPRFGGELGYGASSYHVDVTRKGANGGDRNTDLHYSLQNLRFGLVVVL